MSDILQEQIKGFIFSLILQYISSFLIPFISIFVVIAHSCERRGLSSPWLTVRASLAVHYRWTGIGCMRKTACSCKKSRSRDDEDVVQNYFASLKTDNWARRKVCKIMKCVRASVQLTLPPLTAEATWGRSVTSLQLETVVWANSSRDVRFFKRNMYAFCLICEDFDLNCSWSSNKPAGGWKMLLYLSLNDLEVAASSILQHFFASQKLLTSSQIH